MNSTWDHILLGERDPARAWQQAFDLLVRCSTTAADAGELHRLLAPADRLLAESAWDLWAAFSAHATSTIDSLKVFWSTPSPVGKAVLLLDALSLRELPLIVQAAESRSLKPTVLGVTAAPIPADTDHFARELGVPARNALQNNKAPGTFIFASGDTFTDVTNLPFKDVADTLPPSRNLLLWHTWLDDRLHECAGQNHGPAAMQQDAAAKLASDDFWSLVNGLRQGRALVITGDHGYAVSKLFADEQTDPQLKETFGARRYTRDEGAWQCRYLPPLVHRENGYLVVMGQRRWNVAGGFPKLCHGGMTLLETVVPYVELPPL